MNLSCWNFHSEGKIIQMSKQFWHEFMLLHCLVQLTITSSCQLWFAYYLKWWILDFLYFKFICDSILNNLKKLFKIHFKNKSMHNYQILNSNSHVELQDMTSNFLSCDCLPSISLHNFCFSFLMLYIASFVFFKVLIMFYTVGASSKHT